MHTHTPHERRTIIRTLLAAGYSRDAVCRAAGIEPHDFDRVTDQLDRLDDPRPDTGATGGYRPHDPDRVAAAAEHAERTSAAMRRYYAEHGSTEAQRQAYGRRLKSWKGN